MEYIKSFQAQFYSTTTILKEATQQNCKVEEKVVPQPLVKLSHQGEIKLVLDWGTTLPKRTNVYYKHS